MFSSIGYPAVKKVKEKSKVQQKRLKINPMTEYEDAWAANVETDIYRTALRKCIFGYSANNGWMLV